MDLRRNTPERGAVAYVRIIPGGAMKEFLEFIARHLVDNPEMVIIDLDQKEDKLVFTLKVGEPDVGKVIGKSGRTAHAMRVLLGAVAAKEGKRAILEIAD